MTYLVQLGTYAPLTDSWTLVLDLNDGQTLEMSAATGLSLPAPALEVYTTGNPRLVGERVTRANYGSREMTVQCVLGPMATETALANVIKELTALQAQTLGPNGAQVAGVSSTPRVALLVQPPGVAAPFYADVLALAHDLAGVGSAVAWTQLLQEGLTIELLCAPFLRGPRVTLDNLVLNPGMDQPGQTVIWADAATNGNFVNSYSVNAGSAPTIASNTLTLTAGTDVSFGATTWQGVAQWAVAFTYLSAGTFTFWLHRSAANTGIEVTLSGGTLSIVTNVAGTTTTVASGSVTLTNNTRYWLVASALPYVNANALATLAQAQICTYASGAIGAGIGSALAGAITNTTLQAGQCGLAVAGASMAISSGGGTNPAANQVTLIGADGWTLNATNSDSAASPAWGGWDSATTYPDGPWASQRALTVTAPPAGKLNATWTASKSAVTPSGTVIGRVWVLQTGLSSTASVTVALEQYTSGGTFISALTLATATATLIGSGWYALQGSATLASNCGLVALQCAVTDTTVGASAHATLWADNAQLNVGTALQPYTANRFNKAPAQIQFSGVVGDVAAPCQLAIGTSPAGAGLAASGSLTLYAGRRALAGFGAQLVGTTLATGADGVNQILLADATTWGGVQTQFHTGSANYEPLVTSGAVADYMGIYHLVTRLKMHDTPSANQNLQPLVYLLQNAWLGLASKTDRLGIFQGPLIFPFSGTSWALVDVGQCALPPFALASQTSPTQVFVTVAAQTTTATSEMDADWGALLPVDGDVVAATFQNNSTGVTLTGWIWTYFDGLALHGAGLSSATWSLETAAIPNSTHAGGGTGIVNQPTPALIAVGDATPHADPNVATSAVSGVNQWTVIVTDNSANILPVAVVLSYAPLYLEPR
jgi:hypothetical protein